MGLKQDALGDDWNQRRVSLLEEKEASDKPLLQQVADILKMPIDILEYYDQ